MGVIDIRLNNNSTSTSRLDRWEKILISLSLSLIVGLSMIVKMFSGEVRVAKG